jgi:hypothetical protein
VEIPELKQWKLSLFENYSTTNEYNNNKRETSDSCQAFGKFDDVHSKNTIIMKKSICYSLPPLGIYIFILLKNYLEAWQCDERTGFIVVSTVQSLVPLLSYIVVISAGALRLSVCLRDEGRGRFCYFLIHCSVAYRQLAS